MRYNLLTGKKDKQNKTLDFLTEVKLSHPQISVSFLFFSTQPYFINSLQ